MLYGKGNRHKTEYFNETGGVFIDDFRKIELLHNFKI